MCAPTILHTTGNVSNAYYIAGALIVTFAVIAFAEVCRSARLLNIAIGSSLIVLTLFFWPHNNVAVINSVVSGLAICLLSIPRGRILQRYGGWETKII
jgi:RsiW-degrading membrane proteinase PrsW (M82 family)